MNPSRPSLFGSCLLALLVSTTAPILTSGAESSKETEYRAGKNFIPTRPFSAEDDQHILKAFDGLRVADVTDGMDFVGLQNVRGGRPPGRRAQGRGVRPQIIDADEAGRREFYKNLGPPGDSSVK